MKKYVVCFVAAFGLVGCDKSETTRETLVTISFIASEKATWGDKAIPQAVPFQADIRGPGHRSMVYAETMISFHQQVDSALQRFSGPGARVTIYTNPWPGEGVVQMIEKMADARQMPVCRK